MSRPQTDPRPLSDILDWAIFTLGLVALTTAIAATLLAPGKGRMAQAPDPAPAESTL